MGILRTARELLSMPDEIRLLTGTLLARTVAAGPRYRTLRDVEFKVFSQFGDDGIIQYLAANLPLPHRTFVEFGVGDYLESNTRFLLQKDNWRGFVMDESRACIEKLKRAPFFWKHDLTAQAAFVTRENIVQLLRENTARWDGVDLLHIDVDGNDFWIWQAIDLAPAIVIVEYNSTFGIDRALTIPYAADFRRARAHYTTLYWGCSLKALHLLAAKKGYAFIGCNDAGNNAYFVRKEAMNDKVDEVSLKSGYVRAKYRESRDRAGRLTFLDEQQRAEAIRGMPVFDVEEERVVPF